MNRWYRLSQSAAKSALKFRLQNGLGLDTPCDIYELIRSLRLELQFMDVPTLEGMCLQESEVTRLCVTAQRPWGRQRYTAAHELAHYLLRHGSKIDELMETRQDQKSISDDEILADGFARFLLMPPRAVSQALSGMSNLDPERIFRASCWLGVGYESLVRQMTTSLKLITEEDEKKLMQRSRRDTARTISGDTDLTCDLWPLDAMWRGRAVHVQVGDLVMGIRGAPEDVFLPAGGGRFYVIAPGEAAAELGDGGSVMVRASRRNYVGFYDYRYLPE